MYIYKREKSNIHLRNNIISQAVTKYYKNRNKSSTDDD